MNNKQTKYPVNNNTYSHSAKKERIKIDGMKVLFDEKVTCIPVEVVEKVKKQ